MWGWMGRKKGTDLSKVAARVTAGGAGEGVGAVPATGIGDECEGFFAGRLAAYLVDAGRPVPAFAWLNQVVHAGEVDLAVIAAGSPETIQPPSWRRTTAHLAESLLVRALDSGRPVASLQQELLLPLELELVADPDSALLDAAEVMRLALSRLFEIPGSLS